MSGSEFYNHTTYPSQGASGSSSAMRAELELIEAGFDKLAGLSGNGGKVVCINSGGTAYEAVSSTGTGNVVRATSPTLTTPNVGVATATSINGLTISSSTGTLTITNGKTLSASNTLTFAGTDGSTLNIGTGGTLGTAAYATIALYATLNSPSFTTPALGVATATSINKVAITAPASSATLTLSDGSSLITSGGHSITLTSTGATNITLPTSGTIAKAGDVTASGLTQSTGKILGRSTASTGAVEEITLGSGLSLAGGVLTSSGSAGLVYLSTVTASNAPEADIETTFDGSYDKYVIEGVGIKSHSDGATLFCRVKVGGSYDTGVNYKFHTARPDSTGSGYSGTGTVTDRFDLIPGNGVGSDPSECAEITITVSLPASTSLVKRLSWKGGSVGQTGVEMMCFGSGHNTSTSALTGVRLYFNSGNITGTFRLYGIRNS